MARRKKPTTVFTKEIDRAVTFEEYKRSEHDKAIEDFRRASDQFDIRKREMELFLAERETVAQDGVKNDTSVLARNLDRLRQECGLSLEDLSKVMEIDKTTVVRNIRKGAKPRPETLQRYAQTFSEKLGKEITVDDLLKAP